MSFVGILYLKQQNNILWSSCSLKFEKCYFAVRIFITYFAKKLFSWNIVLLSEKYCFILLLLPQIMLLKVWVALQKNLSQFRELQILEMYYTALWATTATDLKHLKHKRTETIWKFQDSYYRMLTLIPIQLSQVT